MGGCVGIAIIVAIVGLILWLLIHFGLFTIVALIAILILIHWALYRKRYFWAVDGLIALVLLSGFSAISRNIIASDIRESIDEGNYEHAYRDLQDLKRVNIKNLPDIFVDARYPELKREIREYYDGKFVGMWTGTYKAHDDQPIRRLDMHIIDYDEEYDRYNVVFRFYPHESELKDQVGDNLAWITGSSSASGAYKSILETDTQNMQSVSTYFSEWIHEPEGYSPLDFGGIIDFDKLIISSDAHSLTLHKVSDNVTIVYPEEAENLLMNMSCYDKSDSGGFISHNYVRDNIGNTYGNGLGGAVGDTTNWQEYSLNKKYDKLCGRIVLNYDYRTMTELCSVNIYGDDKILYSSPSVIAGELPMDVKIDVSGVNKLRVCIDGTNMIRLVDFALYEESETDIYSSCIEYGKWTNEKKLSALPWLNTSGEYGGFLFSDSATDIYGENFIDIIGGATKDTNFQEYYLGGEYKSMSGTIFLDQNYRSNDYWGTDIKIYCDGVLCYNSPVVSGDMGSVGFGIDLCDVQKLRIEIKGSDTIKLADCVLKK